jgi:trehalose/maltose transport system substrate-binding protein
LLLLLTSIALAACGPATLGISSSPIGPTPTVTVPVELPITIAISGSLDEPTWRILDEQIAAFEAANPDIKVEVVRPPKIITQRGETLAAQLDAEQTRWDIFVLNPTWLAKFGADGWLVPLDEYVKTQGIDVHAFFLASLQASIVDGQLMALPWTIDGGLLYYRQDLLDKHGYGPPATWDDLRRMALDVKTQEGLPDGYVWQGAAYESLTCNLLEFIWAYGGDVLDPAGNVVFDSPETRTALQQMSDLIALGVSPREVTTYQEAAALAAFQKGDTVFMRNWSYAWKRLNEPSSAVAGKVGLAPLPVSCLGGESLALSAYSQHPDQALRFMAFLVRYDQQAQLALHGLQPPALEAVYGDSQLLEADPSLQALHAALSVTRSRPQSAQYPDLSSIIYEETHKMLIGQQDAQTAALAMQRRLIDLLHP